MRYRRPGLAVLCAALAVVFAGVTAGCTIYGKSPAISAVSSGAGADPPAAAAPAETAVPEGGSPAREPTAKDFAFLDRDGNEVHLADFFGKPIVLNFWASWCPPCAAEMPLLDAAAAEMRGDVVFLMVDLTHRRNETIEDACAFYDEGGYSFDIYFDDMEEGWRTYQVHSFPTTFFIDADGMRRYSFVGAIDEETMRLYIGKIKEPLDP